MNPIKEKYPFVDLLKPETEAVVPILLALDPSFRSRALELLRLYREARRHAPTAPAEPAYGGDMAAAGVANRFFDADMAAGGSASYSESQEISDAIRTQPAPVASESYKSLDAIGTAPALAGSTSCEISDLSAASPTPLALDQLTAALADMMPPDAFARFVAGIEDQSGERDIASYGATEALGLLRLLTAPASGSLEKRLSALLEALRIVQHDRSFDDEFETVPAYLEAASALAEAGFRYVILGHTHLAKRVAICKDRIYFNTGTWADLIRFPVYILDKTNADAINQLRTFVHHLAAGDLLDEWIVFRPTYVRLDVCGERVEEASLIDFT